MDALAITSTVATVALVVVTIVYVNLTYGILRAQSEPQIVLAVESFGHIPCTPEPRGHLDDDNEAIFLIVRNVGRGPALNVRLIPPRGFPKTPYSKYDEPCGFPDIPYVLEKGIPAVAPGEEIAVFWDACHEIKNAGTAFDVGVTFQRMDDPDGLGLERTPTKVSCPVHLYFRCKQPSTDAVCRIARQLESNARNGLSNSA